MASETLESGRGEASSPERRRFLARLSITLSAIAAAIVGVPVVGFILGPLLAPEEPIWRAVGPVANFEVGTTVKVTFLDPSPMAWAGVTALTAAWLRRVDAERFIAFAVNCSHLGCPVRWLAKAKLFMCPCHGGVYYADGSVAAGPPPRPLFRYPVRVRNGVVEIQASAVPIE
ncbi:MAG TPA: ubiquinol-cytochrome c reductase iron-sulfur subunit [Candidatus Binataceae bacterium]|jgi:menaquinol-cytochrome c reductase iron-sulfur subunit|nr:ubiquinol-cytochrome c reductase iron-sulfur subunit [Candidatus Binataceae bacterium]